MLIRNSFSNTKKFFQKTLQNFKSFFSGGDYQKLPKSPPTKNQCSCAVSNDIIAQTSFNNKDLDHFYSDFTDQWDTEQAKKRNKEKIALSPTIKSERDNVNGSFMNFSKASPVKNYQIQRREDHTYQKVKNIHGGKRLEEDHSHSGGTTRDLVTQKLKELEMMDLSNVDHVLDIEEVLHYYSRLTCPAYVDIVDKFFMEMYAEFIGPPVTPHRINSRPRVYSVKGRA